MSNSNNPINQLKTKVGNIKNKVTEGASETKMSIVSHLDEFRKRLMSCLVVFAIAMLVCLFFSEPIVNEVIKLGQKFTFIYVSPAEVMMVYLKVSLLGGVVIAFPVIGYHLWRFFCPGLTNKEKLVFLGILTFGVLLFAAGTVFCYMVMMPYTLEFLAGLNTTQTITAAISIDNYVTFVVTMVLLFGLVFELPIVILLLTGVGIVTPRFLRSNRKYVILLIFIVAAFITPPDITTQIMVALPMIVLFEFSILLCRIIFHKREKREREEELNYMSEDETEEESEDE